MDRADEELKETIRHIWPLQSRKMLDLLVPPREGMLIEVIDFICAHCVPIRHFNSR